MSDSELVINRGTARKPDLWLLSKEKFSDEELAGLEPVMRELKISRIPHDTPIRWGKLYDKAALLEMMRARVSAKRGKRGKVQP